MTDLVAGVWAAEDDLSALRGARVLVTGGTGFLGSWIVSSLLVADMMLQLDLNITVVARHARSSPLAESENVNLVESDVRTLAPVGEINFVIHAATSSVVTHGQGDGDPRDLADTIVRGTESVIEAAGRGGVRTLLFSSGAIYGLRTAPVKEDDASTLDSMNPRSIYGEAKRLAETLWSAATESRQIDGVVARLFSFVGPRLPLDAHFAAGNFLRSLLDERPIEILGDGRPRRSYLYAGDLAEWCWAMLVRGAPGRAYNVGSPFPVTVRELAEVVSGLGERTLEVRTLGEPTLADPPWYVPSALRAKEELGLTPRTNLLTGLQKTVDWYRHQST